MRLDLSSLQKAIAQLQDALQYCDSEPARRDPRLRLHLRAAAIQAFEFSYELSVKMLRRFLEGTEPNPEEIGNMTFNELVRLGTERGLLHAELADWKQFRADRGITSHTYNEDKALEVFEALPGFLAEARFLMAQLERRNALS
jgi:nucleotidyltransferase substrate binding protein (TIGR01987 family)